VWTPGLLSASVASGTGRRAGRLGGEGSYACAEPGVPWPRSR
jgi:hypothetical protein